MVAAMLLLAIINLFLMRNCLSLTLTQMVKPNPKAALAGDMNTCPMERRDQLPTSITTNITQIRLEMVCEKISSSCNQIHG